MHCIQDILQSNDNDDLLSNASPHSSISGKSNDSTPSSASLINENHQQTITVSFFDAVKKWLNGKEKEKKEFGDIMRKIRNHSSFDEISQRARTLFKGRNDFYQQLMLLVTPSQRKSPDIVSTLSKNWTKSQNENISLQLPTLNETMHTEFHDSMKKDSNLKGKHSAANFTQHKSTLASSRGVIKSSKSKNHPSNMLNLVASPMKPINDKKRKRDELPNHIPSFTANGHNPSKKRKTSNHSTIQSSIVSTPTPPNNMYRHHINHVLQPKTNNNRNFQSVSNEYHAMNQQSAITNHNHTAIAPLSHEWQCIDPALAASSNYQQRGAYLLPSTSNASSAASTNSSIATTPHFMEIDSHSTHSHKVRSKKHRKKSKDKKRDKGDNHNHNHTKAKGKTLEDVVSAQLMDGMEEDMGLPIHILATIKEELIKENPRNFELFLQGMTLCSIGIIKPDQFVNMMSPLFAKKKKLKLVLHQLRAILHVPLHYFRSTPLYAPFLSDLSTSDQNMNLSIRGNAEQYSHTVDCKGTANIEVSPSKIGATPKKEAKQMNSSKSTSVSAKAAMIGSGSVSYHRKAYYQKNMVCSSREYRHLKIINDEYASKSTGAENNPENDHNSHRNKHEIELNEKEHIMTLWDYYVEQNAHAIQCLKRLESRILSLFKEYKKMFIIRDDYDYDSIASNDDDKSRIVDETNLNFYDSDTYTTVTEDLQASDSDPDIDMNMNDAHSTTSEPVPLRSNHINTNETNNVHFPLQHKSVSNGGIPMITTIHEHKSMMELSNNLGDNESDCTTRSDMTHLKHLNHNNRNNHNFKPRSMKKHRLKLRRKRRKRMANMQKTETDKKYVLSRIYSDINMDEYITPICWSAIHRLYEHEMEIIRSAFNKNPLCTINILLPRLERKHVEWQRNRKLSQQIYRDVAKRNAMKALDWQPKYKRLDKTRLSTNEVWRELIAAQSILNPEYAVIIECERQKRSGLKEQQREQFNKQYSPMDGASSIKPTRLITQHFDAKISTNSTQNIAANLRQEAQMEQLQDDDDDIACACAPLMNNENSFDFRMNIYYNYGLRFDLKNTEFESVIHLPLTTHEHCWNVMVQYLSTEYLHKKIKDNMLQDMIRFYSNFIFLLFEVDLFHEELFPNKIFNNGSFKTDVAESEKDEEYVVKFDSIHKMKRIGANIEALEFEPLVLDEKYFGENIDVNDINNLNLMSYHNRKSHVIIVNRDIYNVLRLYIHLFQRLQKARDLSTNRWRLNFNPNKKEENERRQEKNEREFYGKLMALIQGQIKETEFDLMVQQLFGPEGYECCNIKYLIKHLYLAIQAIITPKKGNYKNGYCCAWEMIKLWHFYYPKWKEIACSNINKRIALLRRYYSDVRNIICSKTSASGALVLIEYFLDSKEIGVQYLGPDNMKNNYYDEDIIVANDNDNDYVHSTPLLRLWQTPIKNNHNDKMNRIRPPFLKKKKEIIDKYRTKKMNKTNHDSNSNNKKNNHGYKRINAFIDNVTMNVFEAPSFSKRDRRPNKRCKKDPFFMMNHNHKQNNNNTYESDDSQNTSKSKRKRNGSTHTHHHHMFNRNECDPQVMHHEDHNAKHRIIWYHPKSAFYFQSINASKTSKRSKSHKNKVVVPKYDKKKKYFHIWHEKRFKEIQKQQTAPIQAQHANCNNNNTINNNKYTFSNGNSSNNINNNHLFMNNNDNLLSNHHNHQIVNPHTQATAALNAIIPPQQAQAPPSNAAANNLYLAANNNGTASINNLFQSQQSTNAQQQQTLYAATATAAAATANNNANNNNLNTSAASTLYALSAAASDANQGIQQIAAVQQQQQQQQQQHAAQQYYTTYRTTNAQQNTNNTTAQLIQNAQQQTQAPNNAAAVTQYVTANYPQYAAYGQYTVGTTPTGYVAIQQQQPNTSYVMDNRTGSIYAAIPATGHYQQSVYPQTQYVSIPQNAAITQHIVQGANGQSTVVLAQPQPQTQQNNTNASQPVVNNAAAQTQSNSTNTMSTPPNVAVADSNNANNNKVVANNETPNNNSMQLPVLSANNNNKSVNDK